MAKKKTRRTPGQTDSNKDSQNDNAQNKTGSEADSNSDYLEPNPPLARPTIYIISGILMLGWMVFLLVVAIRS